MHIKTTCVRCGKKINGTGIYCPACESAPTDVNDITAADGGVLKTIAFMGIGLLAVLVVVAVVLFHSPQETALPPDSSRHTTTATDTPRAEMTLPAPSESLRLSDTAPRNDIREPMAEVETMAAPPAKPLTDTPYEPAGATDQAPPSPETALPDPAPMAVQDSPPTAEADTAVPMNASTAIQDMPTTAESPEVAPLQPHTTQNATAQETSETNVRRSEEIWIYHAKEESKAQLPVQRLRDKGYINVHEKGLWATKYRLNYIFYRDNDGRGIDPLVEALGALDFRAFHHLDNATSQKLRGLFQENPELQFLLILQ